MSLINPDPKVVAELAALSNATLCERLRGIYRIPINDGAGPLNGQTEIVREFETSAILYEAARRIEELEADAESRIGRLTSMNPNERSAAMEEELARYTGPQADTESLIAEGKKSVSSEHVLTADEF